MDRRTFLKTGLTALTAAGFGPAFWRSALATPAPAGPGPYGPLGAPNADGIRLPAGFTAREIARAGQVVPGTNYVWHPWPDGGATFPDGDGWIYVSNSEVPGVGGAGALRFDAAGTIVGGHRILSGTSLNCAGGPTPWGTWLSCEEHPRGQVWECDPTGILPAIPRPALGLIAHEAAAVDPVRGHVYLTEDELDSLFYRFTPGLLGDLTVGLLEAATLGPGDPLAGPVPVTWTAVPDPTATVGGVVRDQVAGATPFRRGEGAWFDGDIAYIATTGDHRVWAYDAAAETIEIIYDANAIADPPLREPDNITVARSGDLFVAEDDGDLGLEMITREHTSASFLRLTGPVHAGTELTGPAFDPSGTRLYFSSQRTDALGVTYEVMGPFRA